MPNYCKECQRYFETREALQQHLQDSSSKHPYCNYCDRIFPSSEGYSSVGCFDSLVHTEADGFQAQHLTAKHTKCQICNRLFNSQIELDDHYLGSSRHPHCCGRGFVDDAAYRQVNLIVIEFGPGIVLNCRPKHQQAVHQIRCRVCDRAFGSRDALEDHYRDSASHPICYDCNRGFMDDNAYYQVNQQISRPHRCFVLTQASTTVSIGPRFTFHRHTHTTPMC
jgi:hypothetical protein